MHRMRLRVQRKEHVCPQRGMGVPANKYVHNRTYLTIPNSDRSFIRSLQFSTYYHPEFI